MSACAAIVILQLGITGAAVYAPCEANLLVGVVDGRTGGSLKNRNTSTHTLNTQVLLSLKCYANF